MKRFNKDLDIQSPSRNKRLIVAVVAFLVLFGVGGMIHRAIEEESYTPQEIDYENADAEIETIPTEDTTNDQKKEEIEIVDSFVYYDPEHKTVEYGFVLKNTSSDEKYSYPNMKVSARDKDGKIVKSDDHSLSSIYPQEQVCLVASMYDLEEIPTVVEYKYTGTNYYEEAKPRDPDSLLTVTNTREKVEEYGTRTFTGEVKNNTSESQWAYVYALLKRKGELVGMDYVMTEVDAKDTVPFEIHNYRSPGFDEVVYMVQADN